MFYFAAAGLLIIAAAIVAWAFLRPVQSKLDSGVRRETVRALYQDRLEELSLEAAAGQVAGEDQQAIEAELGSVLLADYDQAAEKPHDSRGGEPAVDRKLLIGLPVVAAAAAIWLYAAIGDPGADDLRDGRELLSLSPHGDAAELEVWQSRLAARVAHRADDAESWYLLGHTRLLLGQYQGASEAFAVAHALVGPDPGLDMAWLQARYMSGGGSLDPLTREIAERVLERNPSQALVLELFAIDAFRSENYLQAVSMLNRALSGTVSANQRSALSNGLSEARRRLGDLTPSVDVNISADSEVPAGSTLFVIARPVGGGMPYAVVRRPGAKLPLKVRLDDAVSMNPALGLSAAEEIEVVVRLSASGAPMAHPGDWQWFSPTIALEGLAEPVALEATLSPPADS
jgi:cytochrome c-type biogenesis protein CcmH